MYSCRLFRAPRQLRRRQDGWPPNIDGIRTEIAATPGHDGYDALSAAQVCAFVDEVDHPLLGMVTRDGHSRVLPWQHLPLHSPPSSSNLAESKSPLNLQPSLSFFCLSWTTLGVFGMRVYYTSNRAERKTYQEAFSYAIPFTFGAGGLVGAAVLRGYTRFRRFFLHRTPSRRCCTYRRYTLDTHCCCCSRVLMLHVVE